ncbi:hypothetical protein FIBSPDRAFT_374135 [Athelia psychrophila]|uniref:Zn(2)-C6 fungal-type domain-containing protein n=1 Tax=Athelia psychrophila TaxID=1759441 RepID=A0A166VYB5_9AGAM|nr:hypothetical protein FIBSPDRAFT_374135 [Fibularhizoctonia sp. CBS 109695]
MCSRYPPDQPQYGNAHSEPATPQRQESLEATSALGSPGGPTPSLMPPSQPGRRRPSIGTSPSFSMSPSRRIDVIEDVKNARRTTIIKQKSKKKSSMACTRCRQLKKKCHVVPGTRCERCTAQDLVCEYKDVASDPTAPRGPTAGSAPGLEVEVAQASSVPLPPSPPPSPTLVIAPGMPWAGELSPEEALQHAPHMSHPANHALFEKPPSPEVALAPHPFSQFSPLPSLMSNQPYTNALFPSAHHVQPEQPYPIDTGLLGQYSHDNFQSGYEVINTNMHTEHAHEALSPETWLDPNRAFANTPSISPLVDNFAAQASLYSPTSSFHPEYPCVSASHHYFP